MIFFGDIPRLLREGRAGLALGGLPLGAAAAVVAEAKLRAAAVVVPTEEEGQAWMRALASFAPALPALLCPPDGVRPFEGVSPDPARVRQRITARARLATPGFGGVVVIPARTLLLRAPPDLTPTALSRGGTVDRDTLLAWLVAHGYLVTQKVEDEATVAVRGGTFDVWPAGAADPVRIELFDDEVESLRPFDPDTQRPRARRPAGAPAGAKPVPVSLDRVELLPAREVGMTPAAAERAAAWLHAVAVERGHPGPYRRVVQDLRNGVWFSGAEDYLPALAEVAPWVLPAQPALQGPDAALFVFEPERVVDELAVAERQVAERHEAVPLDDRPLVRPFDRHLRADEVRLDGGIPLGRLTLAPRPALGLRGPWRLVDVGARDNAGLRAVGRRGDPGQGAVGELGPVAEKLVGYAAEGRAVTMVVEAGSRGERVQALFAEHGVRFGKGWAKPGLVTMVEGELAEGFCAQDRVVVTAGEVFGDKLVEAAEPARKERAAAKFRRAARESLAQLKRGDFVVHARHGVGLFTGLARMPLGAGEGDFVQVEYRDGEKLYVPVHRLDLVTPWRTVHGEGAPTPRLDRLGGATWEARKAKVKEAVAKLASELLLLYARQKLATAPPFPSDDSLFLRFAEAFPYVETPDQETAIREVLDDLASGRPMDRLLVGDVGFGKTEVAMRAAFAVVAGGAQVAILCPTSVLALQHGETFRRRFAGFPVTVETLSRLRSPEDARRVRKGLADGKVDIVIGTHTLLSREVRFARLGLVVVDEEHRFGTKQKEEMRRTWTRGDGAAVHQLALSATPIPRTLQMSLSGIRSLSVLSTPPLGRQRIRTEIVRFDPDRIREDILFELRRGGQVYFVHNRVQSIDGVARWLERLVPEASFVVAHGQLEDATLERRLSRFIHGEANVLVSTAIVESGIDLPLVNTMLINRGEGFGTAQLYQLRGRIGRGNVRGHCTVLVAGGDDRDAPAEAKARRNWRRARDHAIERLRAFSEHSELGSNFALASHDLELRGSGEILGDRQHGHIAAIGFDAYLELLDEAVARARGELVRQQIEPEVEAPVTALLPELWIPELPERLEAYQHLALCRTRAQVRAEMASLEARFGEAPPEARNVGWLHEARIRCRELGIDRFSILKVRAVLHLHESASLPVARLDVLAAESPRRFKKTGPRELEIRFTPDELTLPFRLVDWVCSRLAPSGGASAPQPD